MKNILKALAVTAAVISFSGSVAFADTFSCTITNTGNGSVNTCVNTENNTTTFYCNNNVDFDSSNVQEGQTGTATVSGNGNGGSAQSGGVTNETFTNVTAELGCGNQPEAPVTPATPEVGGNGSEAPQVLGEATQQVAVKPVGGAGAGAGAGATTNDVAATAGVLGSAGLIALGVALRKRAFNA